MCGTIQGADARGAVTEKIALYVLVGARDGYHAVFSITELSPVFGDTLVLLADRRDGKPLTDAEGPYRLVVPNDERAARSVRQVASLTVRSGADE